MHGHVQFGQRSPRGSCCSDWRHISRTWAGIRVPTLWKEIWTWILTMPAVSIDYAFIQWCSQYNHTDSDWDAWRRCGLTLASVETNATETEVDWHCGKCGDQRDRDRSGLTLWQVWRLTRQRQKVKLKQDPALSFQEAGPEVSTQLRKETIGNQNVECFTHAVPHISSIRLDLNTLRLAACVSA